MYLCTYPFVSIGTQEPKKDLVVLFLLFVLFVLPPTLLFLHPPFA